MGSSQSSVEPRVEREVAEEDRRRAKEIREAMWRVPEAVWNLRPNPNDPEHRQMMSAIQRHGTKVVATMMVLHMTEEECKIELPKFLLESERTKGVPESEMPSSRTANYGKKRKEMDGQ